MAVRAGSEIILCAECKGIGEIFQEECKTCKGSGRIYTRTYKYISPFTEKNEMDYTIDQEIFDFFRRLDTRIGEGKFKRDCAINGIIQDQ